jgi:hypothetical protein
MIEFGDGTTMDIKGEIRLVEQDGSWFVAGNGFMFPADTKEEGERLLQYIESQGMFINMKMFKSPKLRDAVMQQLASDAAAGK